MRLITATFVAALTFAAGAAGEELDKTPAGLEIEPVTAQCEKVLAPHLVEIRALGECALIGVHPVAKDDPFYARALKFVKARVEGAEVRVEVCPNIPVNEQGQKRAVIYYREGEKWWNLNIELIKAGLARVADVPGCHVPTKAWLSYEKEARHDRRGMWADVAPPGKSTSDKPGLNDFD